MVQMTQVVNSTSYSKTKLYTKFLKKQKSGDIFNYENMEILLISLEVPMKQICIYLYIF